LEILKLRKLWGYQFVVRKIVLKNTSQGQNVCEFYSDDSGGFCENVNVTSG
jgi:hypothetical protein